MKTTVVVAQSSYGEIALTVRGKKVEINHQNVKGKFFIPGAINMASAWIEQLKFEQPPFLNVHIDTFGGPEHSSGTFSRLESAVIMQFLTVDEAFALLFALADLPRSAHSKFHGFITPPERRGKPFLPRAFDMPPPTVRFDFYTGHVRMDWICLPSFWLDADLSMHRQYILPPRAEKRKKEKKQEKKKKKHKKARKTKRGQK